jgi:CBS domain-containing protein
MREAEKGSIAVSEFEEAWDDARTIRGAIFSEPLGSVPQRETLTVSPTTSVADVIRSMNEHHVGCALVVRGEELVGIFTERDVLRKVAGSSLDLARTPVTEVMTARPETLPADASIAYALRKMSLEGYRHIPIVDEHHRPRGVVAVRDIVAWMAEMFHQSVLNLPPEPGYPKTTDGG